MGDPRMTLTGNVETDVNVTATRDLGIPTGTVPLHKISTQAISSVATSQTCDAIWQSVTTIAAGGADVDIDLADAAACGGIMEYWGVDDGVRKITFDRVHVIWIANVTTGAAAGESIIEIGADGAQPFPWFFGVPATSTVQISPGGFLLSSCGVDAGWPVGGLALTDILQIANLDGANAADYEIIIIGESAESVATTTTTTAAATTTTAAATTTTAAATTTTAAATTTTAAATTTAAPTTTTAAPTTTTAAATTTAAPTTTTAAPTTTTAAATTTAAPTTTTAAPTTTTGAATTTAAPTTTTA